MNKTLTCPKAILFDLDDTIVSFGGRELLLVEVAEEFASEIAPITPIEAGAAAEAAFLEFWSTPGAYAHWRNRLLDARTMIVKGLFASWSGRAKGLRLTRRGAFQNGSMSAGRAANFGFFQAPCKLSRNSGREAYSSLW